jgi:phospholipid-transporting ATPase
LSEGTYSDYFEEDEAAARHQLKTLMQGEGTVSEGMMDKAAVSEDAEGRVIKPVWDDPHQAKAFPDNYVSTAKYTMVTFLPRVLFEQFQRLANCYFLGISCLQVFTDLSPTGRFTTLGPLVVVLTISAIKEAVEDIARHRQDREVNNRVVAVLRGGVEMDVQWQNVRVGDLVKVVKDQFIPCDLVMLSSSEEQGSCYIETSSLDGETNLKNRQALGETLALRSAEQVARFGALLHCELPNNRLYKFDGYFVAGSGARWPLSPNQILLRGAQLKNTEWVYGLAVFTGRDTKLMMNSRAAPTKRSRVERKTNIFIAWIFALQLLLCLGCAVGRYVMGSRYELKQTYLRHDLDSRAYSAARDAARAFFTFLILFNNFIPISLYVSLEVVKVLQAAQINSDLDMYHPPNDTPALARTSSLNEELGQVEYIFSDKTGTLTRNQMQFKKACVGAVSYGADEDLEDTPDFNFNFTDNERFKRDMLKDGAAGARLRRYATILAVCQTAIPEWSDKAGRVVYQASSPDEAALIAAARVWGYVFQERSTNSVTLLVGDLEIVYEILATLEFNSDRKRMSVVVRDPGDQLWLWTKGADSVMFPLLDPRHEANRGYLEATQETVNEYAEVGLRTLVIAEAPLTDEAFDAWNDRFVAAQASLKNREVHVDKVCAELEVGLRLVGVTAIEDKLQEGVPRTIATLALAGIKIWVLTGDKQGTAINIGYSCRLLTADMEQMILNEDTFEATQDRIRDFAFAHRDSHDPERLAVIIDGRTLIHALDPLLRLEFLSLARMCRAVICCRVTPKQKADVVTLVSDNVGAVTLAIGDGANDVAMIQAAHVGIGISGEEGLQAARAADYAIAQFKFLQKLLLVHGRWSYRRICKLIAYSFYKNITLYATQLWFAFFNNFTGQSLYDGWTIAGYNLIFAALPVVVLATLDQDVPAAKSVEFPGLYLSGQLGLLFRPRVFWGWIACAFWHSIVLFFVVHAVMFLAPLGPEGSSTADLFSTGVVLFGLVVAVVNLKLGLEASSWNRFTHISVWGSVASVWVFYLFYHFMWDSPIPLASTVYQVIYFLFRQPVFWLVLPVAPMLALVRDFAWKAYVRQFHPTLRHIVAEITREEKLGGVPEPAFWDARPRDEDADADGQALALTESKRAANKKTGSSGVPDLQRKPSQPGRGGGSGSEGDSGSGDSRRRANDYSDSYGRGNAEEEEEEEEDRESEGDGEGEGEEDASASQDSSRGRRGSSEEET